MFEVHLMNVRRPVVTEHTTRRHERFEAERRAALLRRRSDRFRDQAASERPL